LLLPFPALRGFREERIYDTGFAPAYKRDRLSKKPLVPARAIETTDQPEGATSLFAYILRANESRSEETDEFFRRFK